MYGNRLLISNLIWMVNDKFCPCIKVLSLHSTFPFAHRIEIGTWTELTCSTDFDWEKMSREKVRLILYMKIKLQSIENSIWLLVRKSTIKKLWPTVENKYKIGRIETNIDRLVWILCWNSLDEWNANNKCYYSFVNVHLSEFVRLFDWFALWDIKLDQLSSIKHNQNVKSYILSFSQQIWNSI